MNEDAEVIARKAGMKGWGIFMLVLGSLCAVFLIVAEVLKMQGDEDYHAVFAALYIILALALLAISAGYAVWVFFIHGRLPDDILVRRGRQITFKGVTFPIEEIAGVNYRRFGVGNSELLMYRSGILTIILKSGVKLRCVGVKGVEAAHDRLIALMRGDVKEDSDETIG